MKKELNYSLLFITLVLIISWSYTGFLFSSPERIRFFVFIMFIPAIVGLSLNTIRYRSAKLVFRPILIRINLKSILFSILYPLLFIALLAGIVVITGIGTINPAKLKDLIKSPPLDAFIIGPLLMFGEEYGWRGFLLKNMAAAKGKITAAIVVGIVWAVWHGPLLYGLAYTSHMKNPVFLMFVQMGSVVIVSIPFAYCYFLTHNILAPMLFHFIWNIYNPIVLGNIYRNQPGIIEGNLILINGEGLGGVLLGLICMIWFLKQFRKENEQFNISLH